ncbi:SDR family NAD(P)-dependent oxidoreductase [Photorhabdus antumapuensis]|uniref:SDR family NAD(P)-dependent oxidoreductase n=1 Tax=Photorhabdus antumapuensis TaxID=2862867 RepID=UPI001CED8A27|nr:SDR family NAD(P)-dependent oxidoreductase [Photorhabdus antumapuensis]MCA6221653.1 SDR family NAD(P)-dependent oxidoreductase [Photorhabdus antumapuensis]
MDLKITGRWAVIYAASEGLGFACAAALVAEGVNVVINARRTEQLEMAALQLQEINSAVSIRWISGDITQPETQKAVLTTSPMVDILITNRRDKFK